MPASSAVEYDAAFGGTGEVDAGAEADGTLEGLDRRDVVDLDWSSTFCSHPVNEPQMNARARAPKNLPAISLSATNPIEETVRGRAVRDVVAHPPQPTTGSSIPPFGLILEHCVALFSPFGPVSSSLR